jgi:nucleoid-associated protein YgaU
MALFDFVRNAGTELLKRAGAGAHPETETRDLVDGEDLIKSIHDLGLSIQNLEVRVDGDTAIVSGKASTQVEREKVILAVGNTKGIAHVDDRVEVEKPAPQSTYYEVKKSDTLSKIAKQHYGDAKLYPRIFDANRPMLKDPNLIYPGQVLRIPPLESR